MNDTRPDLGVDALTRTYRWRRLVLLTLGGVASAVGVSMVLTTSHAAAAARSPQASHESGSASTATAGVTASGVTLCAKHSGAVVFTKKTACPRGDTKLTVGNQSQVSKLTSEVTALKDDVTSLTSKNATLTSENATLTSNESADSSSVSSLQSVVATLNSDANNDANSITSLRSSVTALDTLTTGMQRITDPDSPSGQDWPLLEISGENVEINDGSNSETSTNGLGNLIVGYDTDNANPFARTGSNNLIVGDDNGWSGYGGLLAGSFNDVYGAFDAVSGGHANSANGSESSVSGGAGNRATVDYAAVSGGSDNHVFGQGGSVSGGTNNLVSGQYGSVSGGFANLVGNENAADPTVGEGAWIGGGSQNTTYANYSAILGGYGQTETGGDCATIPSAGVSATNCP